MRLAVNTLCGELSYRTLAIDDPNSCQHNVKGQYLRLPRVTLGMLNLKVRGLLWTTPTQGLPYPQGFSMVQTYCVVKGH